MIHLSIYEVTPSFPQLTCRCRRIRNRAGARREQDILYPSAQGRQSDAHRANDRRLQYVFAVPSGKPFSAGEFYDTTESKVSCISLRATTLFSEQWLEQLKLACLRVETIQKRQSGAFELAVTRRLRLLPKTNIISISVKCVVLSSIWSTVAKQQSVSDVAALDSEDIDYMLLGDSSLHVNGEEEGIELKTFGGPWDAADEEGAAAFPGSNSESSILRLECDARVESLEEASGARELSGSTLGHELMEPSRQADLSNNTAGALVNRNSLQQDSSSFLSGVNKVLKRQFTISNIMQPIKVSVLREAKVELVPITRSGVKVLDEKCVSNTALFHGHLLEDYLQASEDRFARQLPLPSHAQIDQHALNSSKLLTANWQECNFEMGSKCSLSVSECESIQMRLVAETALNKKNIELGRVEFKLESMSAAACVYTWVDLYTTRSGKIVGKALVSLVQDGN